MTQPEQNSYYGIGSESLRTKRFNWDTAELVGTGYCNLPHETHKRIDWYVMDSALQHKYFVQTAVQRVAPIIEESGPDGGTFQDGWNTLLVNAPHSLTEIYREIEQATTATLCADTQRATTHLQNALTQFHALENSDLTWNDIIDQLQTKPK